MNLKAKKFEQFSDMGDLCDYCLEIGSDNQNHPFIILPCGHFFFPDGRWQEHDIEDETKITLTPSIFCSPQKPCWHGYLTNGEFITC